LQIDPNECAPFFSGDFHSCIIYAVNTLKLMVDVRIVEKFMKKQVISILLFKRKIFVIFGNKNPC